MTARLALIAALLCPLIASADVDRKFVELRDKARPMGSLSKFLDDYVGECKDPFAGPECKSNAAAFRKKANGNSFFMIISEDAATMLSAGPYNPSTGEFTINVTPFFAAGGYAITQGAPKRADANGNPILPYLQIKGKLGEGWNGQRLNSLFMRRGLRVQVVFTPKDLWSLPKPGGKNYGLAATINGIIVQEGRTGEVLGAWYGK